MSEVIRFHWVEIENQFSDVQRSIALSASTVAEKEGEKPDLFIGTPTDSDADARLVPIAHPARQSDASLRCLLSSSSPPLQGQRMPLHVCTYGRRAENTAAIQYVWYPCASLITYTVWSHTLTHRHFCMFFLWEISRVTASKAVKNQYIWFSACIA